MFEATTVRTGQRSYSYMWKNSDDRLLIVRWYIQRIFADGLIHYVPACTYRSDGRDEVRFYDEPKHLSLMPEGAWRDVQMLGLGVVAWK